MCQISGGRCDTQRIKNHLDVGALQQGEQANESEGKAGECFIWVVWAILKTLIMKMFTWCSRAMYQSRRDEVPVYVESYGRLDSIYWAWYFRNFFDKKYKKNITF